MLDLAGLDQDQRLEELVEGAESAREEDEALGGLHQHRLARVEVLEQDADVEILVLRLEVGKLDAEAHGNAAAVARTAVRRLHDARAAAGDDGEPLLRQEPS